MDYSAMRGKILVALSEIAFCADDLPVGAQHRIKALEMLFDLIKAAGVEDRADACRNAVSPFMGLTVDELRSLAYPSDEIEGDISEDDEAY